MGSRNHSCNCSECVESRTARQELQHGGMDWEIDDEELVPYRKPARNNWAGRGRRACKKSKTNEPCDYTATAFKGTKGVYDLRGNFVGWEPRKIRVCSRCGKEDWGYYKWW